MTLTELMLFSGSPQQFEEYQKLLKERDKLTGTVNRLSNKIFDEDDSLSVFDGELTDRDKELVEKHLKTRRELETKRDQKLQKLKETLNRIIELQ